MLNQYLITAYRAMLRQKSHSLLNILGLAVGLSAAILIALFVSYQLSFDRFLPHADNTYRLQQHWPSMGMQAPLVSSAFNTELNNVAAVEQVFNLMDLSQKVDPKVEHIGQQLQLGTLFAASSNLTELLPLTTLAGDLQRALTEPDQLALSSDEARRLFGHTEVVGATLQGKAQRWTIAAVFETLPDNSHFAFDLLTAANPALIGTPSMGHNNSYTYLRTRPGADTERLAADLTALYDALAYGGKNMVTMELQAITDIHLDAESQFEMKTNGSRFVVTVCTGLSLLLVAIALINFVNMSTAQAGRRAREVGVKKALGASQPQLVSQFLFESTLLALVAVLLATGLVQLALPWFNALVEAPLALTASPSHLLALAGLTLGMGVSAGLYPALFLSSFSAKRVLSGDLQRGKTAIVVRKSLLTLQAALSIGLIVAAVVLFQQLAFLKSQPVGYERSQRLEVSGLPKAALFDHADAALVQRIDALPGISNVSFADASLTATTNTSTKLLWPGASADAPFLPFVGSGYGIVEAQGLTLLAGRDFDSRFGADWYHQQDDGRGFASIIITESIATMAGLGSPEQAIGKIWRFKTGRGADAEFPVKIVGVVADIQVGSARESRSPLLFICGYSWVSQANLIVTATQGPINLAIGTLKGELQQLLPQQDLTVTVVEENYRALYRQDERVATLVLIFCALAVFLTCIGIFGLSSYSAQSRRKELAIRKVLGASRLDLVNLLAKEYVLLLGISVLVAVPAAHLLLQQWLSSFNDRITPSPLLYLAATALVCAITWLTVASHGLRSASARPAGVLKAE
ncbi:ABC transporter permease [Ferrimonas sp. SCSIO 43195]|uniref:ABC transporter permease n=1 Tax=Ferrimonas sp. SCSIO 43195 TaxID=2822844 RepID=UPI0020764810|nr:ABC transporter permease [Ferrimonas sp. SCSIO 43195]USD36533.1 ABC transporter permease [Ferrimonas sp. SCSIO 43195]